MVTRRCWTIFVVALALALPTGSLGAQPAGFVHAEHPPHDGLTPLAALLNSDGTLNLSGDFSNALDPAGWREGNGLDGAPIFKPDREPAASMVPADTWHALGLGLNRPVNALAVAGADVYAGGVFTDAGGNADADRIAGWDGLAWQALGSTPLNHGVEAIAVGGADVYVGGRFTNAGGKASADYVAPWDGSSWYNLGTGLNEVVYAIAVAGTDVYAGGAFADAGGDANGDRVARWDGSTWHALGSAALNSDVTAIAVAGADVYVGGDFTNAGGNPDADFVARWDGSSWNPLGAGLKDVVDDIAVSGADVYVAGDFTCAGGNPHANAVARWGTPDPHQTTCRSWCGMPDCGRRPSRPARDANKRPPSEGEVGTSCGVGGRFPIAFPRLALGRALRTCVATLLRRE